MRRFLETPAGIVSLSVGAMLPVVLLALNPNFRWMALALAGPLLLVPVAMSGIFLGWVFAAIPEILALARDQRTRVIHGLEHATIAVLGERGIASPWGSTREREFDVCVEKGKDATPSAIRNACDTAISRVRAGETALAYTPKCGSTWLMLFALTAAMNLLLGGAGLLLQLSPLTLLALVGLVICGVIFGFEPLGLYFQRRWTVATDFKRARITRVVRRESDDSTVTFEVSLAVDLGDTKAITAPVEAAPPRKPQLERPKPAPAPPMPGVSCPSCEWQPARDSMWKCGACDWRWNTFATHGRCPVCNHAYDTTQCLSCKTTSGHESWYEAEKAKTRAWSETR